MFGRLRRKKSGELLVYRLVGALRYNGTPMKVKDLISCYSQMAMYDEDDVRRELDKMVEAGIIYAETFHWCDGFSEGWIPYVRLPEQSKEQLAYVS